MKSYVEASLVGLLALTMLVAGCSKPTTTTGSEQTSQEAASSPQPAVTPPAQQTPTQPETPAATPVSPEKQEQPKPKLAPKAAAAPRPAPVAKAPVASEPAEQVPVRPQAQVTPSVKERTTAPAATTAVPAAPKVQRVSLPAGTSIPVRMIDPVDSKTDQVGQTYRASIDSDVMLNDQVVVPEGADARLKLMQVASAGKIKGKSQLQLQLDRIVIGKQSYAVVSNVVERTGASQGKKTARNVGVGAAVGAAIGAIAGGGKGAAIGAGVGAGSGAAVTIITKGEQVVVPAETRLEFSLQQPVAIAVTKTPPTE